MSSTGQQKATEQWRGTTDGTPWMHRALIRILRFTPLWFIYFIMALTLPFYMVFRPKAALAIWHYFRRRQGFGVFKTFCHLWKNHFGFGQVVVDRFAAYAGKKFRIEVVGHNHYREIEATGKGFMMISSHIGNHEMAGYDLRAKARLNVLAYGGEVEEVKSGRARLLAENNIRMVPITDGISHIFVLKDALENGEVVDIHGDRLFGSPKAFECSVLGAPADLPQGPFVLASSLAEDLPVIAVFCVKVGYRHFKIYIERLDAPSASGASPASGKGQPGVPQGELQSALPVPESPRSARERAQALAQRYADAVSGILKRYPDQWYNFFEFWK
ncbi:MAG: hypothetical protein J5771_01395 [Bacteroidales bacterium]|nr:hypothetical protein [Bacteroidales bacterium]